MVDGIGLVPEPNKLNLANPSRNHGEPSQSEFTVVKVEAYNGINTYLSELSGTCMKQVEDVVAYNDRNRGTEGAYPGDHQAFPSGQVRVQMSTEIQLTSSFRTILN